jgi:TolB-like protein/tetratricopeptide (TPR) repeat protein
LADLFVSYKREDAAKVGKLVAALRGAGLNVWWDADIPASAPWETTIEAALREANAVIVCWSPASVASENVRSEARVAREDGRLIQAFVKPCLPPLFFGERQGIDLTKWRGNPDDPRIAKIAEAARAIARGERAKADGPFLIRKLRGFNARIAASIAAFVIIAGSALGWWLLSPAKASVTPTLAVLPFRSLSPTDTNLVDAIWDDTRGAISRNPNLRVLGRQTVETLAKNDLDPAGYREKVGADYLLDGNVQHSGERIVMNVSLVRTKDGAEVWNDKIATKVDDIFAVQSRIASDVEGKIRGRVAPGGGVTAKNIATSGEVYSLYAEARAKMRERSSAAAFDARNLLKKAIAMDPNYAPAWADLGQISGMGISRRPDFPPSVQREEAMRDLKRALDLAPNLAHAHAALALVQNFPPELDGELRKAVELDPNDAEAWTWIGNVYQKRGQLVDALAAHRHAAEIEPMWDVTVVNVVGDLVLMKNRDGVDSELKKIAARGDPVLTAKARGLVEAQSGNIGEDINIMLRLRLEHPDQAPWVEGRIFHPLMQLGFIDEAFAAWGWPLDEWEGIYRGIPVSAQTLKREIHNPLDIWESDDDSMAVLGRLLPKNGRLKEYVGYYDAAFKSPDELFDHTADHPGFFISTAPTLAANLRAAGRGTEADAILRHAEDIIGPRFQKGQRDPGDLGALARIRGAEGRDDDAVSLLRQATLGGDLPDRRFQASDIADEPCFARLVNRADFQAIRKSILARIDQERRKVSPVLLARSHLQPVRRAA